MIINKINYSPKLFFKGKQQPSKNAQNKNCDERAYRRYQESTKGDYFSHIETLQNGDMEIHSIKHLYPYDIALKKCLTANGDIIEQRDENTVLSDKQTQTNTHYKDSDSSFITEQLYRSRDGKYITQSVFQIVNEENKPPYIIHTKRSKKQKGFFEIAKYDLSQYPQNIDAIELIKKGALKPTQYITKLETDENGNRKTQETYDLGNITTVITGINSEKRFGVGSKTIYKIQDKNNAASLDLSRTFTKYEDFSITTVNGKKYVAFFDDNNYNEKKITIISRDDKSLYEINFNDYIGLKTSAQNAQKIWELLKSCPADMLLDASELKEIVCVDSLYKCQSYMQKGIIKTQPDASLFAHELGHFVDYQKNISNNEELVKICDEEEKLLRKNIPDSTREEFDYLSTLKPLEDDPKEDAFGLQEIVADTYTLLHGLNHNNNIVSYRTQILKQYFPKTIAKIAQLLKD